MQFELFKYATLNHKNKIPGVKILKYPGIKFIASSFMKPSITNLVLTTGSSKHQCFLQQL